MQYELTPRAKRKIDRALRDHTWPSTYAEYRAEHGLTWHRETLSSHSGQPESGFPKRRFHRACTRCRCCWEVEGFGPHRRLVLVRENDGTLARVPHDYVAAFMGGAE